MSDYPILALPQENCYRVTIMTHHDLDDAACYHDHDVVRSNVRAANAWIASGHALLGGLDRCHALDLASGIAQDAVFSVLSMNYAQRTVTADVAMTSYTAKACMPVVKYGKFSWITSRDLEANSMQPSQELDIHALYLDINKQ